MTDTGQEDLQEFCQLRACLLSCLKVDRGIKSTGLLFSVSLLQPFTLCLDADGHWLVPLKLEKRGA